MFLELGTPIPLFIMARPWLYFSNKPIFSLQHTDHALPIHKDGGEVICTLTSMVHVT